MFHPRKFADNVLLSTSILRRTPLHFPDLGQGEFVYPGAGLIAMGAIQITPFGQVPLDKEFLKAAYRHPVSLFGGIHFSFHCIQIKTERQMFHHQ